VTVGVLPATIKGFLKTWVTLLVCGGRSPGRSLTMLGPERVLKGFKYSN